MIHSSDHKHMSHQLLDFIEDTGRYVSESCDLYLMRDEGGLTHLCLGKAAQVSMISPFFDTGDFPVGALIESFPVLVSDINHNRIVVADINRGDFILFHNNEIDIDELTMVDSITSTVDGLVVSIFDCTGGELSDHTEKSLNCTRFNNITHIKRGSPSWAAHYRDFMESFNEYRGLVNKELDKVQVLVHYVQGMIVNEI